MKTRIKIFEWFLSLTKYQQGVCYSWHQIIIHWILFPIVSISSWLSRHYEVRYDFQTGIVHIGKYKYSRWLLDGNCFKPGDKFEITSLENNTIGVKKLKPRISIQNKDGSLIEEIEVCPEDKLILESNDVFTDFEFRRITQQFAYGIRDKIIILDSGLKLKVLRWKS